MPGRARLSEQVKLELPKGDFAAYIFDCDGTLADTMPLHYQAWCGALREHQLEFPQAMFYELGGVPTVRIVEILNERHHLALDPEETAQIKEKLYLEMVAQIGPIEPVVAIAREMHGKLPMAVASGGHREIVKTTLNALGILNLFEVIIGSEDYENGKPAPDPFLTAAARLGVAPERCLVFEDTQIGVSAAWAAGMKWVLVPTPDFNLQKPPAGKRAKLPRAVRRRRGR